MDIDRYIQRNDPTWRRLEQLSRTAARSVRRLGDDEVTELVHLYQLVSAHLSHVRTAYRDPDLVARLSRLLGEARVVIYRRRSSPARALATFFGRTFPGAVWHIRTFLAVSMACFLVPAISIGVWLANSPEVRDASVPPEVQQLVAESEFRDYYRSDAAQNFAGQVTVNNIFVAFQAFALGVVPVLGPLYVLVLNGLNVGVTGAVMHAAGEGPQFWGLILPHGLLEITAVLIAGAAGLRLSWAIVAPGDRTRADALREEGQRSVAIVLGLVVCFVVAGFIEGFITPSGLPTALRVAVGVVVLLAFDVYISVLGRRAEELGSTGLIGEDRRADLEGRVSDLPVAGFLLPPRRAGEPGAGRGGLRERLVRAGRST
jgi:uncharacterized membrane protein SpoIIM required for sporulation